MAMSQSEYQLALTDLESFLKPESFLYVLTVVNRSGDNKGEDGPSKIDSNELGIVSSSSSQLFGDIRGIEDQPHPKIIPQSRNNTMRSSSTDSSERGINKYLLSPMQQFHRHSALSRAPSSGPGPVLCSQLPLCRRIFYKYEHGESIKRRTRTRSVASETDVMAEKSPFQKLVGKINPDEPPEFDRGRKLKKAPPGVRRFSNPVSNPLYKNYNPLGYIKNEDEIAREFILKITDTFNEWLASFDGVLTQLDPEMMIKTLRDDLELSFNKPSTSTLHQHHGVEQNKNNTESHTSTDPVVYKSRFRFDQPKFKLDLA